MAPLIAALLQNGLGLLGNAVLAKGKQWVEEKTGLDLEQAIKTPDGLTSLRQAEMAHEEVLLTLRVEDNRISAELEKARIAGDVAFQAEAQVTARIDAQSTDEYVRRTRPKIARQSFYLGAAYAGITGVVFPAINAITSTQLPTIDPYILGALYSPCLTLMGVRSVEAFSRKGKT